jgi:hypothetical protein
MLKVAPLIFTLGTERFKMFLSVPFTVDMLYPVFNDKSCDTIFDGWRGKDMLNWHKFTNEQDLVLEFYPTHYDISKRDNRGIIKYKLTHLPKTINDFINDMDRYGVQLYWSGWVEENLEPKDFLHRDEIKPYYINLLEKLGKSSELSE